MELLLQGLSKEKEGQLNEAVALCIAALSEFKGEVPPFCQYTLARLLHSRGHAEDRQKVIELLRETLKGNPNHLEAETMLRSLEPMLGCREGHLYAN